MNCEPSWHFVIGKTHRGEVIDEQMDVHHGFDLESSLECQSRSPTLSPMDRIEKLSPKLDPKPASRNPPVCFSGLDVLKPHAREKRSEAEPWRPF